MSLAVATEVGYARIPGADHKNPTYHWKLTPGEAYRLTSEGHEIVNVDEKLCKKAGYTFCLQWISGRTVALFEHEDVTYAQPIREDPKAKGKKAKEPAPREAVGLYDVKGTGPRLERPAPAPDRKSAAPAKQPPKQETIKSQEEVPRETRRVKGQRRLKVPLSLFEP